MKKVALFVILTLLALPLWADNYYVNNSSTALFAERYNAPPIYVAPGNYVKGDYYLGYVKGTSTTLWSSAGFSAPVGTAPLTGTLIYDYDAALSASQTPTGGGLYSNMSAPTGATANSVAVFLGSPLRLSYLTAGTSLQVLRVNVAGTALEFATPDSYATMTPPSGCAAGYVPYFSVTPPYLTCSPVVWTAANRSLDVTDGRIQASVVKAIGLATPSITPPISPVLSLFTTVTVVEGASLVDGDYFTLSDGSAVVYEFDNDSTVTEGRVGITFVGDETAQAIRDLVVVAINGSTLEAQAIAAAADTLTVTSDAAGDLMGVNSENVANAGFLVPVWGEPTHVTTYGYVVEACLASGECAPSAEVQTAIGHAELSNRNYNSITATAVTGAAYYKFTRVTGTPAGGDAPPRLIYTGPLLNVNDTNDTSTSDAPATRNETGVVTAAFAVPALDDAPADATTACKVGEIRIAADFIYLCSATDTWVRAALVTWP